MTTGRRRSPRRAALVLWVVCALLAGPIQVQQALARATPEAGAPEACPADVTEATDQEPNNLVTELQPIAGAVCLAAELTGGDQDLFVWTVSEDAAARRWTIELSGLPGQAGVVQLYRPEYASDGVSMTGATSLLGDDYQPGAGPATLADFLLAPGDYIVGVASSGAGPYRLLIGPGTDVPDNGDAEPNDDAEAATAVEAAFALSGDRNGSVDRYAWTLDEATAASHWRLSAQFRVGDAGGLRLFTLDGTPLYDSFAGTDGLLILEDVGLDAGTYLIEIPQTSPDSSPYILEATPGEPRAPGLENEPNDDATSAVPLPIAGPTTTLTGRLATIGGQTIDTDTYWLTIDQSTAGRQLDLKVFWQGGSTRTVCLTDALEQRLRCADGDRGLAFNDLVFPAGDYLIEISGNPNPADPYLLRLDLTIEAIAGYETEPNDTQVTAGALDVRGAEPTSQGRFVGREEDYYRFTVAGEPQLWRAVVEGTGIERFAAVNAAGQTVASGNVDLTTGTAQVSDLYLLPGDHWFGVIGTNGDYTIRLVPLGPPDPTYEREPNNSIDRSQPIRVGETRTGRLVEPYDQDLYRFALLAQEHVTIRVEPPADGIGRFRLAWGTVNVVGLNGAGPGEPVVYEAVLPPGDYALTLEAQQPSEDLYRITIERNDPFMLPDDAEPNDTVSQARPFPPDLIVSGAAEPTNQSTDEDWYLLPPESEPTEVVVAFEPGEGINFGLTVLALASGETSETALTLTPRDAEDHGGTLTIPPGQPIAIGVRGRGDYRLAIERDDQGGLGGLTAPQILPVSLELATPRAEIAAYWTDAQRVDAELTLTNSGDEALDLTLDALVSNELWDVTIEAPTLTLAAGETATVPVSVRAGPDAWADYPVRVTVRARDAEGLAQTTALEIAVGRETPPLNPETGWALPPELLGGLNVAWAGLGGQPVQTDPTQFGRELALYDDLAASGVGWYGDAAQLATGPIELTVDLAGEEPVPVAGIALNPFGYQGVLAEQARGFEVLVSDDGQTFEAVYVGELSALPVEQSFVFAEPVETRFVRLRVSSNQLGLTTGEIVLGEWKVIAQPGWSLPAEVAAGLPDGAPAVTPVPATEPAPTGAPVPQEAGLNIAAPSRGGHVVIIDPQYRDEKLTEELLVAGGAVEPLKIEPGGSAAWVIGFQHDRAAQIAALSWVDPVGLPPDALLFESVDVSISLESPIGPWMPLGTWELGSAADSSIFSLDQPVWARYVRFTATVPPAPADESNARPGDWHYPAQIAIFERPADEEYRSIAGEWGQDSRAAGYEIDNPPAPIVLDDDAANGADGASLLPLGDEHRDSVWVGRDEDWYRIEAPADAAFLEFTLTGSPTLDVEVALFDEDGGDEIAFTTSQTSPREATYTAEVTPGATYLVRVSEPPTSLVIAFDTSQSLLEQLPVIYQGLAGYAQDVVAGQEVVNFLPFGENMLLDEWGDDPNVLQLAITNYPRTAMSSDVEAAQLASIRDLEGRPGTQAILLITDAETSSYDQAAELWGVLGQTAPRIFAVNIGAGEDPWTQQDWMEDWASVNSGVYSYVRSQGDLDVAFDRAATILRRPSIYGISVEATAPPPTPTPEPTSTPEPTATPESTSTPAPTNTPQPTNTPVPTSTPAPTNTPIPEPTEPPTPTPESEPGYLRVVAPAGGGQEGPVAIAGDVSVALIIDTSGSMLQPLESSTRADVAKGALIDLVTNTLPAGTNVSLRAFGTVPDSCETRLVVPQAPLDSAAMAATIQNLEVVNLVKTPLGASLAAVAEDLGTTPGPKLVVFVTDGEETCGGDPAAAIQALMDGGIDVRVNIVGFALDDEALKEQFEEWARLGNGLYFDAADAAELGEAIADAVAPLYNVIDEDGQIVVTGQVGGSSVRLPAGAYTVEVLTEPTQVYEGVVVPPGERVRLELAEETAAGAIPLARAGTVATAAPPFSLGWPVLVVSTGLLGLVGLYRGTSRLRDRQH